MNSELRQQQLFLEMHVHDIIARARGTDCPRARPESCRNKPAEEVRVKSTHNLLMHRCRKPEIPWVELNATVPKFRKAWSSACAFSPKRMVRSHGKREDLELKGPTNLHQFLSGALRGKEQCFVLGYFCTRITSERSLKKISREAQSAPKPMPLGLGEKCNVFAVFACGSPVLLIRSTGSTLVWPA